MARIDPSLFFGGIAALRAGRSKKEAKAAFERIVGAAADRWVAMSVLWVPNCQTTGCRPKGTRVFLDQVQERRDGGCRFGSQCRRRSRPLQCCPGGGGVGGVNNR